MKCVLFRLLSSAFACNRALFRHFYRFGLMSIFTTVDFARTRRELKYFVTSNGSYHIQINRIVRFHVSWRTDQRIEQPSTRSALHAKWIYPKTQKKYVNRFSLSHFRFILYKLTLSFWTQWEEKVKNHIGIVHLSVSIKTHTHTSTWFVCDLPKIFDLVESSLRSLPMIALLVYNIYWFYDTLFIATNSYIF